MEPEEIFFQAAVRETTEEAGININVMGILRLEHTPFLDEAARFKIIMYAEAADDRPLKDLPDHDSL